MMPMRTRPVVALFNSSDDLLELLRMLFEDHGYLAVTGHINDLRKSSFDLQAFVDLHNPSVGLYDLIPPFERQWAFLDHLRAHSPLRGLPFILMSTNERLARTLAGRDESIIEVVGRPFEFPVLLEAVRRAIGEAAA
jgi:DNA-binding NtrC family response regulator